MAEVTKHIEIPDMNPIRFIKENHPFAGYQTLFSSWFKNQLSAWSIQTDYCQKFNLGDYIGVQIFVAGLYADEVTKIQLQIVDCKGNIKWEFLPTWTGALPGNTWNYNGVDYSMTTVNWQVSFFPYVKEEGKYYLRIKLPYAYDGDTYHDYHLSEPISLKQSHDGTRLLEYISYTNKLNVDYRKMFFHLRIEGDVVLDDVNRQVTAYDDQQMHKRQQEAQTYRLRALRMGNPKGCPMWLYDKVNRAADNDYFLVDKVRCVADGKVEIGNKVPRYQRYGAKLALREYDERANSIFSSSIPLILWPAYSGSSYYLYKGAMENTAGSKVTFYPYGYEVNSQFQEDALLNLLNTSYRPINGLSGEFRRDGTNIVFINGQGESYNASTSLVFTKSFTLKYSKYPSSVIQPTVFLETTRCGIVYKDWFDCLNGGDGSTSNYSVFGSSYTFLATDTTASVRVWHDDYIKTISATKTGTVLTSNPLTYIDAGDIPANLERIGIEYGVNNLLSFAAFPTTLKQIQIVLSSILFTGIAGLAKNWVNLSLVGLASNFFNSSQVDAILNALYNGGGYTPQSNGAMNLRTIGGASPPTAASLTARNWFISYGWTILTD